MNKVGAILLVVALMAMGVPTSAQAQSGLDEVEIFTESETDAQVTSAGQPVAADTGRFKQTDLAGLFISESFDHITFRVAVNDPTPENDASFVESGRIDIHFTLGSDDTITVDGEEVAVMAPQYYVRLWYQSGNTAADLYRYDAAAERYVYSDNIDNDLVSIDAGTASYIISVPRNLILDHHGAEVSPALPLHDFMVEALAGINFFTIGDQGECCYRVHDIMPDDGTPAGEYIPQLGIQQTGHLDLSSPAPVRASNGEATTYVFDIRIQSTSDFVDDVNLIIKGAPSNWDVRLPATSIRLDNATVVDMPVLVSIPFGHEHGAFDNFVVEAHSSRDPSAVGRVELGVRYTKVPQPSGHHSQMWLHSTASAANVFDSGLVDIVDGGRTSVYMNALKGTEDGRDQETDVGPDYSSLLDNCFAESQAPTCVTYRWFVLLEPSLQMGLDFDTNSLGELIVPFRAPIPMQDAVVRGELHYYAPDPVFADCEDCNDVLRENDGYVLLGTFEQTEPQSVGAGAIATFETTFTPMPESDYLLYQPHGASLAIELELNMVAGSTIFADQTIEPKLIPGGELVLPLNEYHDPVDDLYVSLTDVEVAMESEQERFINSGETVLYEVRIENTGVVNDRFRVRVDGHNEEWATILGDSSFAVRSHESRRVVIAVAAPLATNQGDTVDLILEATSESDENARALVRLYAEVDNTLDHENQAHLVPVTSEELTYTPVGAWLAPLALLGVVLLRRRF